MKKRKPTVLGIKWLSPWELSQPANRRDGSFRFELRNKSIVICVHLPPPSHHSPQNGRFITALLSLQKPVSDLPGVIKRSAFVSQSIRRPTWFELKSSAQDFCLIYLETGMARARAYRYTVGDMDWGDYSNRSHLLPTLSYRWGGQAVDELPRFLPTDRRDDGGLKVRGFLFILMNS